MQTNQPYYSPHSMVDGAVYIDVYRPISASSLNLRLKGTERVKWEELKQAGQNPGAKADANNITEKIHDKIENFRLEVPLFQIGGMLNPGQYQYPFAFQLPDHLPGTFNVTHLDHQGRVRYSLTAVLFTGSRDPIKYRSELVVRQVPNVANYNAPVNSEQSVCVCCVSKGRCRLECCFQSDCYQPGQDAVLMCKADNKLCSVAVKCFNVSLLQHITFRTKLGKHSEVTRMVTQSSFPGVAAGADNLSSPQLMTLKLEDPSASKEAGKLSLQPNVYGQLVDCRYDLEVRPTFDAPCSCCARVPVSTIPLHIYAPQLPNWITAMPTGFRPTVYDIHQIVIPLPGVKFEISAPTMAAVPSVSMNVGGPSMQVTMPAVHANMMGAEMNMNVGGANMRIDMPAPTMEVHTTGMTGDVSMSTNMTGMNANIKF
ncbi:MAG: hypothetical protein P4L10_16650 [Acidobacteriaceae bacterium]|nr:hypothetical protein [Acidobacteriaceae bacterium]